MKRWSARALTMTAALTAGVTLAAGPVAAAAASPSTVAGVAAPADDPAPDEQAALRQVATAIWGADLANGWEMNSAVADVLSQATHEILRCSEAFSLVPKPPGWLPGPLYLVKYAKNLYDYFNAVKGSRTYRTCVVGVAYDYRTQMDMASQGL
ncbi:hypothetical protein [Streptomyces orinoci]|uniref:Uncharacterized protein n=1 Tax=Streptomyces orinoci TaxID=67339 RepID=A0ABV3JR14_STRON|nr:hypothetical protein [Streptomyces orinoci]